MKIKLILMASLLLLGTTVAPLARTERPNPTVPRPETRTGLSSLWLLNNAVTLEGTIDVSVERNPKNFTCADIRLSVLRPKSGLTNQTLAVATAKGNISSGKCTYKLTITKEVEPRESLKLALRSNKAGPDYDCTKLELRTDLPESATIASLQEIKTIKVQAICIRF